MERSELYTEHAPPADLRAIIACTWVARAGAREASPHVAGPATCTHVVSTEPGTSVVGIRFKPRSARLLQ
jgi:hypothetical protein